MNTKEEGEEEEGQKTHSLRTSQYESFQENTRIKRTAPIKHQPKTKLKKKKIYPCTNPNSKAREVG